MTGIIFDYKRYAIHDGPGIRITVFLKGCPLRCKWCHNPESLSKSPDTIKEEIVCDGMNFTEQKTIGNTASVNEVMQEILKEKIFFDESGGGVTFSGGEPMMQPEFLLEILEQCKENNIHTVIDTSGFSDETWFRKINPYVDLYLFDLKIADNELHKEKTGVSNESIISNLKFIDGQNKDINIRIPIIPGITDSEENLDSLKNIISGLKNVTQINLLPYHAMAENKYQKLNLKFDMPKLKSSKKEDIAIYADIFKEIDIPVRIGG